MLSGFLRRLLAATMCIAAIPAAAQTINLLDRARTGLVGNLTTEERTLVRQLTDGDRKKDSHPIEQSLEFVVDLGKIHAAEQLDVYFAGAPRAKQAASPTVRVELLGSIASAQTGYQLLRQVTPGARRRPSRNKFLPVGVRWLMVRLSPSLPGQSAGIAELVVRGRPGPPKSRYAFQDSPADARTVLARLREELALVVSADERALFRDAADGKLDEFTLADAALLASGVSKRAQRLQYLRQLDRLYAQARNQLASHKTDMARAQALLRLLHRRAFDRYQEKQTDLSVVLDSQRYNCVSSAVLYSIVGRRLGLDVRGIEVPDHAFAIVYDGTAHADVETTTAVGFNPSRNRKAIKAFADRTGFAWIPASNAAKRRETTALGLIALIYYNHGVSHSKAGRHEQAVLAYYRALSLDPKLVSAVKNTLSSLGRWAEAVSQSGDHEQSLSLLSTALALAPADRTLIHNRRVVWHRRINTAVSKMNFERVLALTQQAHRADPKAGFDRQQARVYIQRGQVLIRSRRWREALQVAGRAAGQINQASLRSLNRFRLAVVMNWMASAIKRKDWSDALQAVTEGAQILPANTRLQRNAAYLLQEWSEAAVADKDIDAAIQAVQSVRSVYPRSYPVRRAARNFVLRRVHALRDSGQPEAAAAAVSRYQTLLGDDREAGKIVESIYGQTAASQMKARAWRAAAATYERARDAMPKGAGPMRSYQQNMAYIMQEWLKDAGDEAPVLAGHLLTRFRDVRATRRVVSAYFQRRIERLHKRRQYDKAAQLADDGYQLLGKRTDARRLIRFAYDRWARFHSRKRQWQQAVDVYREALGRYPTDSHLKNNAVVAWHSWAKPHLKKKEWAQALAIYERGLEQMPGVSLFKQNIRYCRQQMGQG